MKNAKDPTLSLIISKQKQWSSCPLTQNPHQKLLEIPIGGGMQSTDIRSVTVVYSRTEQISKTVWIHEMRTAAHLNWQGLHCFGQN